MRHWVRGALGAALVYPLIWHYSTPSPVPPPAGASPAQAAKPVAKSLERAAPNTLTYEPEVPERKLPSRSVTERVATVPRLEPTREPELRQPGLQQPDSPQLPTVANPSVPLAAMPELTAAMPDLKEVMARASEVQQHAHDPGELDKQVQTLDEDPAKLARLKALADMFVRLPTPREDSYLPSSTGARSSTAR